MGFYAWVRESVKQAVLLGVSDAVESLGSPQDPAELNEQLVGILKQPLRPGALATGRSQRKRLGRSLDQLAQRSAMHPAAGVVDQAPASS